MSSRRTRKHNYEINTYLYWINQWSFVIRELTNSIFNYSKSDSRIKLEGQMRAKLETELIDELVEFCKTNSLLAIIAKVLESKSWTWSEVYIENKIEMLKWICEFVEKDKKYQYVIP